MATYTFAERLARSVDPAVKQALNTLYSGIFPNVAVIQVRELTSLTEQRMGRDVAIDLRKPRDQILTWTIEEKIRTPEKSGYPDLCTEYLSNAERGTLGWAYTSQADWLSYVRQIGTTLDVLILPMQAFRLWFAAHFDRYDDLPGRTYTRLNGGVTYETRSKAIPFADDAFKRFLAAHGHYRRTIPRCTPDWWIDEWWKD